jgi:diguanylate cyclase (GGDEF)-like protein/PAS domain S-box-containing protein
MALAMKAHAKGENYQPDIHSNIAENRELVSAFNLMKKEVDTRQKKLEAILDNAAEGIITFDADGKIVNFNKAAECLFQRSSDSAVGKSINDFIPGLIEQQCCFAFGHEEPLHPDDLVMEVPRGPDESFIASIKISNIMLEGKEYFTALISDISEQVEMLNNLKRVAERDSLTGLFNRKYLLERLDGMLEERPETHNALLYIDLDNFKFANDTLGHLAGDQILVEVTRLLGMYLRKDDLLARLGGDEFAIILHGVDEELAIAAANDFRQSISAYHFVHTGKTIDIGCSVGIAMMNEDITRTEELLAKADYACHVAKTKGRNMVHLYQSDDRREVAAIYADMGWTRIIKRAIEHDRFFLVSQPIVDSADQSVFAREVLIRLNDQNSTIAMPNGFIPAAERFGLMPDIDRWVISRTIGYLQEDVIQGRDSRYSINLSAASFNDASTLDYVRYLLEHSGVSAAKLIFEITETMAISHMESATKTLEGLRALGCRTALDDFGAGHASYLYLKDLPVDFVKIDGSFIKDLLKEPLHMAMVRSMKEVADAVGIRTIAEYVEDRATMEALLDLGIDYLQGFYLGRPEPISTTKRMENRGLPR